MDRTETLFEQIEAYLDGTLEGESLSEFEDNLAADDALKNEVEKHRALKAALNEADESAFQAKMDNAFQQVHQAPEKSKAKRIWPYWSAAAMLTLLVTSLLLTGVFKSESEKLYEEFYVAFPAYDVFRGDDDTSQGLKKAFADYTVGKFEEALPLFEEQLSLTPQQYKLYLYVGNCQLQLGQHDHAITTFQQVPESSQLYTDALWFQGMIHLKVGQVDQATALFRSLSESDNIYSAEAAKIINRLNHSAD
ncbi:MAG: tetratricopeptide repeat protein [Bacteroidota bacterium]